VKKCQKCAQENPDEAQFCQRCGEALAAAPPLGQPLEPERSGMAIASLVSGLLFFILPAAILAVVLGHLSRAEIRRSTGRKTGSGMALAGLILGYCGVAIIPVVMIVAAIAIPSLLRSKMAANEASAVGSLRMLNTAAVTYFTTCGSYPHSLTALGRAPDGRASANHADLVDGVLTAGTKSGYIFRYEAFSTSGRRILDAYTISAQPVTPGTTGQRYFFTDQSGVIRMQNDGPASKRSPPLN
jgi:type II secretory pathway pseudopilin PulG